MVTNAGSVTVKGGTFRPNGYTQTAGITEVTAPGILRGGAAGTGAVAINGGTLTGGGNVQGPVTNAARVAPGGNGTPLSVSSTYTQTGAGELAVSVSGSTTPGTDFSKLTATGRGDPGRHADDPDRAVVQPGGRHQRADPRRGVADRDVQHDHRPRHAAGLGKYWARDVRRHRRDAHGEGRPAGLGQQPGRHRGRQRHARR